VGSNPAGRARILWVYSGYMGNGMLVFMPGAGPAGATLPSGEYRLQLTYRRNNRGVDPSSTILTQAGDSSDEVALIDAPWPISS
jgi:hypothetical protein